ncbi:hypothetical protein [Tenacibaculum sp. SZ-18]|uniref:hypothetical protein n=1 Tax=Tenacibaculum sp. SZ-18 TaxID=754423 RepID=UPI0018E26A6D|nr:hypothetical protein [Tenacibaculum sp. SZ-18]
MKKILLYIALFCSSWMVAQTSPVEAIVDTTNIRIGEQFEYKISVEGTENVIIPKLELKGLEVVDSLRLDTLKNKLIQKYILTGFDSGAFYIPKQQIFIRNQAHFTDSLLINVATVKVDTTQIKMFEIKGIKGEPYQFDDYKNTLYWILGILFVVTTVLYFALKRSDNEEIKTREQLLNPYQEAVRNLKLLEEKLLWQNNKVKQYYSELTDIVRNFIERELNVPALETTTRGLIETLSDFTETKSILTDKETITSLNKLLQQADLVKFAKSKPLAHEIEADRNIAKHIVDNIKPNIEIEESSEVDLVIIVEKPIIKNPSALVKIIALLLAIGISISIAYSISKVTPKLNSLKTPITNVE